MDITGGGGGGGDFMVFPCTKECMNASSHLD